MKETNRSLTYGRTTAAERGQIKNYEATWDEIVELFREPVRRKISHATYLASSAKDRAKSKNTGLFFGGRCRDGHRGDSTLEARTIVNLDLDDNCDHIWDEFLMTGQLSAFEGLAYLLHTTRSHTAETPKMRLLLPLARDIEAAEYEPVARALAERLDISMKAVARESYTPAQGMYFPSASSDQEYHFAAVDGDFFDPDEALEKYPADDASKWPKKVNEKVTEYVAGRKMTHPEDKKAQAPIIAAVHRAFDPWTFIDRFLSDIYIQAGERYYPVGASGAPSVRIYDDAFIQSDHGSDRAVGQHNTFDLGRIHLFGDLDADYDTENLSPAEWPSYKAMTEFMLEHEEVREHLEDIEAEIEVERNETMMGQLDDLDDDLDEDDPDDLTGELEDLEDEEVDDLIGEAPKKAKKKGPATIEDVLRRVRKSIAKAKDLNDLERRLEIIRNFPVSDFRDLHRDLVAPDIQKKFHELAGEKITRAVARKMLTPTLDDLRSRAEGQELPDWMKNWVFVTSHNEFLNLDTKQILSREGFNGLYAIQAGEQFGVKKTGVSIIAPSDAALSVYEIPKPYATRYFPGKPELFEEDGVLFANTFRAATVSSGGYKGKEGVKLLARLMKDLFPLRDHRAMIMDFVVHCVRFPEKKLKYALLIKGQENEGKSLLAMLLEMLLGGHNCSLVNNDMLKEKFNGWAHEKLLCVVEEVRMPGREAHEVLNKLKPVVTNPVIPIRVMQKDVRREPNFCNIYLTTNHEDSLPMEEDNSRYLVLFTRFKTNAEVKAWHRELLETEGRIYTRDLFDHIRERPAQFLDAFAKYEFSEFYDADGRAPDTVFKTIMAEDAKSEERQLLEGMLDSEEDPTITRRVLIWNHFREILDARGMAPSLRNRAVPSFLKPLGFVRAKPWTLRQGDSRRNLTIWTTDTSLLNGDYTLTQIGMTLVKEAVESKAKMDEDFDDENVVPLRRA